MEGEEQWRKPNVHGSKKQNYSFQNCKAYYFIYNFIFLKLNSIFAME